MHLGMTEVQSMPWTSPATGKWLVLALVGGALMFAANASCATAVEPATRPVATQASRPSDEVPPATQASRRGGPELFQSQDGPAKGVDPADLLWQMLAYVLLILVLGAVALVVVKKVLPRLRTTTGKSISVVETVYLAPRQTLHLLQVGGRRLLVGCTREGISMLADLGEAVPDEPSAPAENE